MKAVRYHDYGPADVLVVEDAPRPEPKDGEVLVRVHAAGVNPVDWKIRQGNMRHARPLSFPAIPGSDLAGTVAAVGPGVTTFQPGQAVFGTGSGAYAEYAIALAAFLAPMPSNLTFDQAASVTIGARTAWKSLFDVGGLQRGQRLFVQGAAGGVGLYAVQFGHWNGAYVIGATSTANVDFVRSLGADEVIDYTTTPFEQMARNVDLFLDTVGGSTPDRAWPVLRPGGIFVTIAGPTPEEAARQHGVRAGRPAPSTSDTETLQQIAGLIESGAVTPVVGTVFPLEAAKQAQLLSETGHGRGRIVLHITD